MKIASLLIFFFVCVATTIADDGDPISDLAEIMAVECMHEPECRAKYAIDVRGSDPKDLQHPQNLHSSPLDDDIRAILVSHGLGSDTCRGLLHALGPLDERARRRVLLGLAMDLSVACADPRDIADSKSSAYTVGAAAAMLVVSIASFVALFILSAASRSAHDRAR